MIKKKLLSLIVIIAFVGTNKAQEYILRNVESERINSILLMELSLTKDTNIVYYKDKCFEDFPQVGQVIKEKDDFSVSEKRLNLMFKFLNPLKYSISINSVERDDEELKNGMNAFLSGVTKLGNLTSIVQNTTTQTNTKTNEKIFELSETMGLSISDKKAVNNFVQIRDSLAKELDQKTIFSRSVVQLKSLTAMQLYLFISQNEVQNNKFLNKEKLADLINSVQSCEMRYFDKKFETEVRSSFDSLASANDYFNLKRIIAKIKLDTIKSKAGNNDGLERIKLFDPKSLINFAALSKRLQKADTIQSNNAFYYTLMVTNYLNLLIEDYQNLYDVKMLLYENFKKVYDRVQNHIQKNFWKGDYYALIQSMDINRQSFYDVTISINAYKYEFKNGVFSFSTNQVLNRTFSVKRIREVILAFSGIAAYSNVSYASFTTDNVNGVSIVKEIKGNKNQYNIGLGVNFLPNWRNTYVLPGFQFALSLTDNHPIVLTGVCFALPDWQINISGGVLFNWNQVLGGGLKDGSEASAATIEQNTTWQFNTKPNFYLGISYNIPWKNEEVKSKH